MVFHYLRQGGAGILQFLKAYRWQYIFSGATHLRFQRIVKGLISEPQFGRIEAALASLT
jgi:hypothetical protein